MSQLEFTRPIVRYFDRTTPPHITTLILLASLGALAMNIFLPSLPGMTTYFETDYRMMQLSISVYLGMNAVLQIFAGPISDKYGRRPVILWAIALFLAATIGCILAPTAETFLLFRMMQAVAAALMLISRAAVRDMVPTAEAASMIGYVTMGMSIVPMISPAIGGVLEEMFDWRANFIALFIVGAVIWGVAWMDMGETKSPSALSITQQFKEYPELLRSIRFWGYALASALSSGSFFAFLGGAPFVATTMFNMSPTELGIYFGAPTVGYMVGNFVSGQLSARVGVNRMVLWGCLINGIGMGLSLLIFALGYGSALSFFGFVVCVGLGNGLTIPNATAGALSVRPQLAGTASGLSGAILVGLGALISATASALLTPETGAFPLLWLMFICAALGCVSIMAVMIRDRRVKL